MLRGIRGDATVCTGRKQPGVSTRVLEKLSLARISEDDVVDEHLCGIARAIRDHSQKQEILYIYCTVCTTLQGDAFECTKGSRGNLDLTPVSRSGYVHYKMINMGLLERMLFPKD